MESSRFFLDANNNLKIQIKAILFNRGTIFYDTFWYRLRVMVFNAPFNNISDIWWRKPEYPEKTTDLSPTNFNT
jgi:hypothetical protein